MKRPTSLARSSNLLLQVVAFLSLLLRRGCYGFNSLVANVPRESCCSVNVHSTLPRLSQPRKTTLRTAPDEGAAITAVKRRWGIDPDLRHFSGAHYVIGNSETDPRPPILELPRFLSRSECTFVKDWAKRAIENGAEECGDYLNARVNCEVANSGVSQEGKTLIDEFELDEVTLAPEHRGGFRIRLDTSLIADLLQDRLLSLLGMPERRLVFEEGAWIRPTPKTVVVRDQTVVFYGPGNGVPPHVDGKDGTLLVYLSDGNGIVVPEGVGGRTVFPEDNFTQVPVEGTALLYRSKTELLHFSEAMTSTHEKWIMQLLLDYNHDYKPGDTVTDFQTGHSYVWDGH